MFMDGVCVDSDFDRRGNFVMSMVIRLVVDGTPTTSSCVVGAVVNDIKTCAAELSIVAEPHVKPQRGDWKYTTDWFILVYVRFPQRMFKH